MLYWPFPSHSSLLTKDGVCFPLQNTRWHKEMESQSSLESWHWVDFEHCFRFGGVGVGVLGVSVEYVVVVIVVKGASRRVNRGGESGLALGIRLGGGGVTFG